MGCRVLLGTIARYVAVRHISGEKQGLANSWTGLGGGGKCFLGVKVQSLM